MKMLAFCVAAALVGGCATIDRLDGSMVKNTEDGLVPVEEIHIMNTNWRLLSCIPIASGNPAKPNKCSCLWFSNSVTLDNQIGMLEAEVRRAGAKKAVNVFTDHSSEGVFFFLMTRSKLHTSAVLVKDPDPVPVETPRQ